MNTYSLQKEIKVTVKGDLVDCSVISIPSPNMNNLKQISKLQDIVGGGIRNMASMADSFKDKDADDASDSKADIISLLMTFGVVEKYSLAFRDFMKEVSVCEVDENTKPKLAANVDKLDIEDFKNIMSEYSQDHILGKFMAN